MEGSVIIVEKLLDETWEWKVHKKLSEKGKTSPQVSSWGVFVRFPKKTEINF